ncbi:hypothetical protein [Trinickia sp. EG282A]|uniref:hypothetical protein n=1 Tax=Trinickia sp. EG282A TaxID=3237013 RepID=UPI0034D1EF7A
MADVEVHIDLDGSPRPVGLLRRHASRREETVTFECDETWLADDERFSISREQQNCLARFPGRITASGSGKFTHSALGKCR